MEFFKNQIVTPIDRKSFLKITLKYFLVQFFYVFLILFIMQSELKAEVSTRYLIYLVCPIIAFIMSCVCFKAYKSRFKDIYPEYELGCIFYIILFFIPLLNFVFFIFLCSEKGNSSIIPNKIFYKASPFFIFVIPLFLIQLYFPVVSYWIGTPTNYYFADTFYDADKIVRFNKHFQTSNECKIENYIKNNNGRLNVTEIILLTAAGAQKIIKEKQLKIETDEKKKIETSIKYGVMLFTEINEMLEVSEKSQLDFLDFSLFHWLTPTGAMEIALISVFEGKSLQNFNIVLFKKSIKTLAFLNKDVNKLPIEIQHHYRTEILKTRNVLMKTKTSRAIASAK